MTTGIDLARQRFEHWMKHEAKIVVGSSDPYPAALERDYWRVWQAALARATPQHSVTEQDELAQIDLMDPPDAPVHYGHNEASAWGSGWLSGYKAAILAHLRAQPLASTAATQPEQAGKLHGFDRDDLDAIADGLEAGYPQSVDVGGSPLDGDGPNLIASTTMAAAKFIRAALAIPASTATGERQRAANIMSVVTALQGRPEHPEMRWKQEPPELYEYVGAQAKAEETDGEIYAKYSAGDLASAARDASRYRFIEENATTTGGGHGFTITCFVPFDREDMGCGIDAAIMAAQKGK